MIVSRALSAFSMPPPPTLTVSSGKVLLPRAVSLVKVLLPMDMLPEPPFSTAPPLPAVALEKALVAIVTVPTP